MWMLAWRNLTADRRRLTLSVAGVAFAVLLMVMQLGYRSALLDSSVKMIDMLDADVVLLGVTKYRSYTKGPFPRRRVQQAAACPGVASSVPLYVEPAVRWRNPSSGKVRLLRVIGFSPTHRVFADAEIAQQQDGLKRLDTALFDQRSRTRLGHPNLGSDAMVSGHSVRIIGNFSLGTDFAVVGNLITSEQTFLRVVEGSSLASVEVGLIKLGPGAESDTVIACLEGSLPADVVVISRQDFAEAERAYWAEASPVGQVFALGTLVGFVIGLVICYQILFTEIFKQLPQFATLKAMGYGRGFLSGVVLGHALGLSGFGFGAGLVGGLLAYVVIGVATGLAIKMSVFTAVLVFLLTATMCAFSGMLVLRKVLAADPAELF